MLGRIQPLVTEHVLLLHRIANAEGGGSDDDLALGGGRSRRIEGNRAGNAGGISADGLQRRIEPKGGVINPLRVFEVEGLWGGEHVPVHTSEHDEEIPQCGLEVLCGCFHSWVKSWNQRLRKRNDAPSRIPDPNKANPRKSMPGTNRFW